MTDVPAIVRITSVLAISHAKFDILLEDGTGHGRLGMAVRFDGDVYLFELEVMEMAGRRGGDDAVEGGGLRGGAPRRGGAHPPGGVVPHRSGLRGAAPRVDFQRGARRHAPERSRDRRRRQRERRREEAR